MALDTNTQIAFSKLYTGPNSPARTFLHEFGHFVLDRLIPLHKQAKPLYQEYVKAWKVEAPEAMANLPKPDRDTLDYYLQKGNGCGHDDPCEEAFAELFADRLVEEKKLASVLPECAKLVEQIVGAFGSNQ